MYPGGNNYNQNYPNQQQGYNMPSMPYGTAPGAPPIGFNVGAGMAQAPGNAPGYGAPGYGAPGYGAPGYGAPGYVAPGYGAPGGYNQNQGNSQSYIPPSQNYQTPQQSYAPQHAYAPQGQYIPPNAGQQMLAQAGQHSMLPQGGQPYQQSQFPPTNIQGYGNQYPQIPGQQNQYNQGSQMNTPGYGTSNPPQNPSFLPITQTSQPLSMSEQTIMNCIGSGGETYRGTIKPHPNFNAEQDSNVLKKAMKGLGTDEKAIIECLGRRNLAQRLEIKKTFKKMFGKDLIDELKSELSGNFSRAVVESLYDSDFYDAYSLHKAMEGAGTREDVLTEILTSRSNQQINSIKDLYKKWFKKDLEKEVISETSGFYKRVLVSCLQANKKELTSDEFMRLRQQGPSAVVNINLAKQEAQELYNAGEKKLGTDEACFIRIFASRNKYQLRATFEEYKKVSSRDIITSIEREMSGDLASSLKAIAMQAIDPALYFATRLYKSMKGAGTNDTALIRILLTRSEIDLENIKIEFQKNFKKTLESFVQGDTSGDYLKYLMRFVQGN